MTEIVKPLQLFVPINLISTYDAAVAVLDRQNAQVLSYVARQHSRVGPKPEAPVCAVTPVRQEGSRVHP
jgi:hypothetical protein